MAKVVLDSPRVLAVIGELVAARMAKHVAVDEEREARRFASPRNHALIACNTQGRQTLRNKHVNALGSLTLEPAKGAQLTATYRVNAGCAALRTPEQRSLFDLPMSHHDLQSCLLQRLNQ
jgi:hypothetical protein